MPATRPSHAAVGRAAPQIPQPAHRPGSRSAPLPRTVNRISSRNRVRSRPILYPAVSHRRLQPLYRGSRYVALRPQQPLHSSIDRTPMRYGPAQATPDDFLEAANVGQRPAPIVRIDPVTRAEIARSPILNLPSEADTTRTTAIDKPELQTVERAAATPLILPTLRNARGRLIVPAPLLGSREILLHQNEMADRDGLVRVQDDDSLEVMRERRMLLPIPISESLHVDERLPANRRYSRPWTTQFLITLAHAHYARFHTPLVVTSAVRTVEFQQRLLRTNGNAAPAEGASASPHLTGQAIDLGKHGLSVAEIAWLRGYLLPLITVGSIDVEEEFQQSCFHISVYKRYAPPPPPRYIAASRNSTSTLATAIR